MPVDGLDAAGYEAGYRAALRDCQLSLRRAGMKRTQYMNVPRRARERPSVAMYNSAVYTRTSSPAPSAAQVQTVPAPARPSPRPRRPTFVPCWILRSHRRGLPHAILAPDQHRRTQGPARLRDCVRLMSSSPLDGLLRETDFERSFSLLVELGREVELLECAHSVAVADAFGSRRNRLQGRIAL